MSTNLILNKNDINLLQNKLTEWIHLMELAAAQCNVPLIELKKLEVMDNDKLNTYELDVACKFSIGRNKNDCFDQLCLANFLGTISDLMIVKVMNGFFVVRLDVEGELLMGNLSPSSLSNQLKELLSFLSSYLTANQSKRQGSIPSTLIGKDRLAESNNQLNLQTIG